jgi:D-glycero-beta-D-manno-heptose-7-phosphate kinase
VKKLRILVVGDVMVDWYTFVSTTRDAMEAPIPIWDEVSHEYRLGGAANVAANIKSIGGDGIDVFLAGIADLSSDPAIIPMLDDAGLDPTMLVGSTTMVKRRYARDRTTQIIFRSDSVKRFSDKDTDKLKAVLSHVMSTWKIDAVVFSDYDKGTIDADVVASLSNVPMSIVDSKRKDVSIFAGSTLIKLNEFEYSAQSSSVLYTNFTSMFTYCVVTKGARGADLLICDRALSDDKKYVIHSESFPAEIVKAVDVTGCGDTHTAAMAYCLVKGGDVRDAVRIANMHASRVVQKFGTAIT